VKDSVSFWYNAHAVEMALAPVTDQPGQKSAETVADILRAQTASWLRAGHTMQNSITSNFEIVELAA
jgi:uncharacterized phage-associated protein